jgi:hypothetical protein
MVDQRTGTLRWTYHVPAPPVASDAQRDRLYIVDVGFVRALTLGHGAAVAMSPGAGPLALDSARGLVAYVRQHQVEIASARSLRQVGSLAVVNVTALAFTPDGETLLVGLATGIAWVDLGKCAAR